MIVLHRGGNCWSLHLALNQANTGSIPVLGARWNLSGIAWSKRCGLGPRMDSVQLTDTRLFEMTIHRGAAGGSD